MNEENELRDDEWPIRWLFGYAYNLGVGFFSDQSPDDATRVSASARCHVGGICSRSFSRLRAPTHSFGGQEACA